jgi:carboxyl-terminal processing protease
MRNLFLFLSLAYLQAQTQNTLWLESFDKAWSTVAEKYWDPKMNGVDWQGARAELRPKVASASSPSEARQLIESLLARLGHSHVGILPAEMYNDDRSGNGVAGFHCLVIGGEAVIERVDPASAAWAAGIRPGYILHEVRGRKVRERLDRLKQVTAGKRSAEASMMAQRSLRNLLRGEAGEKLEVLVEDGQGRNIATSFALGEPKGKLAQFGYLPPIPTEMSFQKLSPQTGLLRWNIFLEPDRLAALMAQAVQECAACTGLVIDLRDNPGGIGALAPMVVSFLVQQETSIGICTFRQGTVNLYVNPRAKTFNGKVAVLVNSMSMSTSEFLALGLQDLKRGKVFGQTSLGAALPSSIEKLPSGDALQYTTANYVSAGGKVLEGVGVTPDVVVQPTRAHLLKGGDPILDTARHWIESEKE